MEYLSGGSCYGVFFTIEVSDFEGDSCECFQQGDLFDVEQISSSSIEGLVLFYLDPHVYITSDYSGLN